MRRHGNASKEMTRMEETRQNRSAPHRCSLLRPRRSRHHHSTLLLLCLVLVSFQFWNHSIDHNLLSISVSFLRTIAPWFLWSHWNCFPTGLTPQNENGVPAHRFGVALMHIPEDYEAGFDVYQRELWQIAEQNRLDYCQRHGYTFINGTQWAEQRLDLLQQLHGRTHWLKSLVIQDTFTGSPQQLDWILFLDTDVMILNLDIRLEQIIAGAQAHEGIVVTTEADRVNAGAFVAANTPAGRAIIDVWATGKDTKGWSDQKYFHDMFDEHQALRRKGSWPGGLKVNMTASYRVVKPCALQCCSGLEQSHTRGRPYTEGFYAKGDFSVHFFGKRDKLKYMRMAARGSLGFFS